MSEVYDLPANFDEFVDEWYKQGGKEITNEVNEKIHK